MQYLKSVVFKLLCNPVTGSLLKLVFPASIPDLRWKGFRFIVPSKQVNKRITASIFWGFYESSEIRYIEKYLTGELNVIEFGSSIGVVSSHIVAKLQTGRKLIAVEANPFLVETIKKNAGRHNGTGAGLEIINKAVDYEKENVYLTITDNNTETRISNASTDNKVAVSTCRLSDLIGEQGWHEYVLVCDIEGSEAAVFMNDKAGLKKCSQLFIELHDTVYRGKDYSVDSMVALLTDEHGFHLKDRHGPVCVFDRK